LRSQKVISEFQCGTTTRMIGRYAIGGKPMLYSC
jgi:hypothetical protein